MTIKKLSLSLVVASMIGTGSTVLATTESQAAPVCGKRSALLSQLANEFGEAPTAIGLASDGGVVELLTSHSGSWTLIVTLPPRNGQSVSRSCLLATGDAWQTRDMPAKVVGRPA